VFAIDRSLRLDDIERTLIEQTLAESSDPNAVFSAEIRIPIIRESSKPSEEK